MLDFLTQYTNPNEERINFGLIDRSHDDDLIDLIIESFKSLEVLKYIKFLGYEKITDEKKIDLNDYMSSRKKPKKHEQRIKYMYLHDNRYIELKLHFGLSCKGKTANITKRILVPLQDENGYYTIKGKKRLLIYQLVDSSTYTNGQKLVLKSFRPVTIKREIADNVKDTLNNEYSAPIYKIEVFGKNIDILLFYFAKIGANKTLEYFNVDKVISFSEVEGDNDSQISFSISNNMFLIVNKYFFEKYQYIQSMCFMILSIVSNRLKMDMLDNKVYWTEKIGSMHVTNAYNYYEKGKNTLTSFSRMIDETTKNILKIRPKNKKNIYSIIRWIIQNYPSLRQKDNLDLSNKRLRCNEYIASLLTKELSQRVNRIIAQGNKVTIDILKDIFKFSGDVISQQLHKSGLFRYDDRINDMDFFNKFKYTIKGPNSLGGKNDKNIAIKYRNAYPSYIGKIDINVCGTSDPGSSGIITPFAKTEKLFFNADAEPQDGIFDFIKDLNEKENEESSYLNIDLYSTCENINDLFKMEDTFASFQNKITSKKINKNNDDGLFIMIDMPTENDDII